MQRNEMLVVSIDGISGTGKSQIMRSLIGYYRSISDLKILGFSENLTAPGRLALSEKIDAIRASNLPEGEKNLKEDRLFTESAVRDRIYISRTFIPFARQAGTRILLLDRWFPTNMAYQSLNGLMPEKILSLHRDQGVCEPDFYIILTCPVGIAVERVDKRITKKVRGVAGKMSTVRTEKGTIDIDATTSKKLRIQNRFLELPGIIREEKCLLVDTNNNMLHILANLISRLDPLIRYYNRPLFHIEDQIWDIWLGEGEPLPEYPFDHQVISG